MNRCDGDRSARALVGAVSVRFLIGSIACLTLAVPLWFVWSTGCGAILVLAGLVFVLFMLAGKIGNYL